MARRSGQITARGDRKWLVRWYVGTDDNGKRSYSSKTVHGKKRDAQTYLTSVLRRRDLGVYVEPARVTLNKYLDRWLDTAAQRISPRTLDDYRRLLVRYVRSELGERRLDSILPPDIQAVYDGMHRRGLAARTVRMAHAPLRQALEQAVRWGLLATNPARLVQLPRHRQRERRALSHEEVQRLRVAGHGTTFELLWELMLLTGLRPAEGLALRWADLNINRQHLTVHQALHQVSPGHWEMREPKTPKSRRTVPLSPRLIEALRSHRKDQAAQRLRLAVPYRADLDLIFASRIGTPLDPNNVARRHFRPLVEAAELPDDVTPYVLRHTCATLALEAGVPVLVVAERLGHASATMTLNVYGHVLEGQQAEATERLEKVLG